MYFLAFFVLVWSYPLGTTVHLSVSCSLVERGRRAQTLGALSWSCEVFFFPDFFFFANCSPDVTHVCLSVSVWTASFCTAVILTSQSVWSIVKRQKYQNERSAAMMPVLFLFTSVRVSITCCRWKEGCRCWATPISRVRCHQLRWS